jgi:hypothetical protein
VGPTVELVGGHELVDESRLAGRGGCERLGEQERARERSLRETVAEDLDRRPRHGEADCDLVRGDPRRSRRGQAVVAGEQQERAHRDRMAGGDHQNRPREREEAPGELEAADHHGARRLAVAALEDGEVEARGEDAVPSPQLDDRGRVPLGPIEGLVQRRLHRDRHDVDLAVVHTDARHAPGQLVGHGGSHLQLPPSARRPAAGGLVRDRMISYRHFVTMISYRSPTV